MGYNISIDVIRWHKFGFKKECSCSHAIHSVKTVVDYNNTDSSMINLCALEKALDNAFDKMDDNALFSKRMELPVELFVSLIFIVNYLRSLGFHNYILQIMKMFNSRLYNFCRMERVQMN